MRAALPGLLLLLTACKFHASDSSGDGGHSADGSDVIADGSGGNPDAHLDAGIDAQVLPDANKSGTCFGTGVVVVCYVTLPTRDLVVDTGQTAQLDTDTIGSNGCDFLQTQAGSAEPVCVVGTHTVTLNGTLRAIGSHPLVIVATDAIVTNTGGKINVSSTGTTLGAGGDSALCGPGGDGVKSMGVNGGGAGGSFVLQGGTGGGGTELPAKFAAGGSPAAAVATSTITVLRGGCPGGSAGGTNSGVGLGGGAIDLIAGNSVTINDEVDASGGGGAKSAGNSGGNGGGAGGMIVFDAPAIVVNGSGDVFANGGGGAQGTAAMMGGAGGVSTAAGTQAPGGSGTGGGNTGGAGGYEFFTTGGGGAISTGNGGGGGGGCGYVATYQASATGGGTFSPGVTAH